MGKRLRKRYRVLILAAIVVVVVVPFGLALSIESQPFSTPRPALGASIVASTSVLMSAPLIVGSSPDTSARWWWSQVPDGASLLGLGAVLIGLAAAVRRTV
jgi:hypothetical protein